MVPAIPLGVDWGIFPSGQRNRQKTLFSTKSALFNPHRTQSSCTGMISVRARLCASTHSEGKPLAEKIPRRSFFAGDPAQLPWAGRM
jgi:hypothetical protein